MNNTVIHKERKTCERTMESRPHRRHTVTTSISVPLPASRVETMPCSEIFMVQYSGEHECRRDAD
jgi:hypothetical protein